MSALFWYKACATSKRDMQPIWILQLDKYIQFPIASILILYLFTPHFQNLKE